MLGIITVSAIVAAATESVELEPVHEDSKALERAVLKVTRSFLRDDLSAVKNWLSVMQQNGRLLYYETDMAYGPEIIDFNQSYYATLEQTALSIAANNPDRAFEHFKWVQRYCIDCHRKGRELGIIPYPGEQPVSAE
jgi:hypothetical protein